MGCVFTAYDAVLKRRVAVKLVFDSHEQGELALRFHQEAKLASRLKHPNIVRVLDFGIGQNGTIFLIMDLVEGATLYQILKDSGPMDVETALPMFIQICDALAHAHSHGIVHRDLKPKNIMIAENEPAHLNVRIVDFGIAKLASSDLKITRTGHIVGTPLYSSPEQIKSKSVDSRSDIYSFGCVMLEVLTGSPPFRGATQLESYDMHLSSSAPRLQDCGFEHEHLVELDRIIATALNKDPKDRYQSFDQLKGDLIKLLPDESRAALYQASEICAENDFVAKSFFAQYRFPLLFLIFGVIPAGALLFLRFQGQNPAAQGQVKFAEQGISPTQREWRFFCSKREGRKTWINIDCRMSDKHFKQLKGKNVRSVVLYAMRLNGSGLRYLKDEPLENLSVAESKIEDAHLHNIGALKQLRKLDLSYTWISDPGLATIATLPRLMTLGLAGCTKLTSKSIDSICRFAPELAVLDISYTPVGEAGYEKLRGLKKLRSLDISLSDLTDQSVEPIFKLKNLEVLSISKNNALTDATIKGLKGMHNLKSLEMYGCGFSSEAIEQLKKSLPSCQFVTQKRKEQRSEFLRVI